MSLIIGGVICEEIPVLEVHGMFHGADLHGRVGLFVDIDTEGFF